MTSKLKRKSSHSIYKPKPEDSTAKSFHQFMMLPIKAGSEEMMSKIMHSDEVSGRMGALHGLKDLEFFAHIFESSSEPDIAIIHGCFTEKDALKQAAPNVQRMLNVFEPYVAGPYQLLSGESLIKFTGTGVLGVTEKSSYCCLNTIPLTGSHADSVVASLREHSGAFIPSIKGLVGLDVIDANGVLVMISIHENATTARAAVDLIKEMLRPTLEQWHVAPSSEKELAFEGALLWTCGSQGFSQAANFVRVMPLQAKPNEAGALISAVEGTRHLIAEQHDHGLVHMTLVQSDDDGAFLAIAGWWGEGAASQPTSPTMDAAFAGCMGHVASRDEPTLGAVFWRWEGEAALSGVRTPGYVRLTSTKVNADQLVPWVEMLDCEESSLRHVEGLITLETLLVQADDASTVVFVEVYTTAPSAVAASGAIKKLIELTAPDAIFLSDVLHVQSGPVCFTCGTV